MTRSAVGDGSAVGGVTKVPLSLGDGDVTAVAPALVDGPGDAAGSTASAEKICVPAS